MTVTSCPQCSLYQKEIAELTLKNEQLQAERDFFKKQCAQEERDKHRCVTAMAPGQVEWKCGNSLLYQTLSHRAIPTSVKTMKNPG